MPERQSDSAVLQSPARPREARRWNVVLLDDDQHTYEYVIEMLVKLFQWDSRTAYQMACEVDRTGRVIAETTYLERAEFKREQIHGYGADPRIARSEGSMRAVVEPADA